MTTIRDIWNEVKLIGYNVRIRDLNGLTEWQPLKVKYSVYVLADGKKLKVSNKICQLVSQYYMVDMKDDDHVDSKIKINETILINSKDVDHFIIQHFRIPKMSDYNLSILKFAQIAYNAGQYEASKQQGVYDQIINDFYTENNLGLPETFLDDNTYLDFFIFDSSDYQKNCQNSKPGRMIFVYDQVTGLGDDYNFDDNFSDKINKKINKNIDGFMSGIKKISKSGFNALVELSHNKNKQKNKHKNKKDKKNSYDNHYNAYESDSYFNKYKKYKSKYLLLKKSKK